jgi:uncharacterized protein with HEPN domain
MSSDKDHVRLCHMLDACLKIQQFTKGLSADSLRKDEKLQLAVIRLLEIAGEAANGISDQFKEKHPEVPWTEITATRNRLIHGYFDIDLDVVGKIIAEDIPPLVRSLQTMV